MRLFHYNLFLVVFGIILFPVISHAVIQYTVTDLGSFGGDYSIAYDVNESGVAAGYSRTNEFLERIAFVWDSGLLTDIGNLGKKNSISHSINDYRQIVGSSESLDNGRAFLWLPEPAYGLPAGMNDLGTLGGVVSDAKDINNRGQVVGKSAILSQLIVMHAFLWENGSMQDLGTLEGSFSEAFAINDHGIVVGRAEGKPGDPFNAFIWLSEPAYGLSEGMNRIGDPSMVSAALDINNEGYVVGALRRDSPYHQAFIWEIGSSNAMQTIMEAKSTAIAINDNGWVVGGFEIEPETSVNHAFLFRNGQVTDLNNMIDTNSGWILTSATDISNSGFIVGMGQKDGVSKAFILTPIPEPLSFSFAFGTLFIFAFYRRSTRSKKTRG